LKVANIKIYNNNFLKKGFLNSIPNDLISYFQYKNLWLLFLLLKKILMIFHMLTFEINIFELLLFFEMNVL